MSRQSAPNWQMLGRLQSKPMSWGITYRVIQMGTRGTDKISGNSLKFSTKTEVHNISVTQRNQDAQAKDTASTYAVKVFILKVLIYLLGSKAGYICFHTKPKLKLRMH